MSVLQTLLRLRALWVSLLGVLGSLLLYFAVWPNWMSADRERRGALLIAGGLFLWAVIEWALLGMRHYREQQTRPGLLRRLFRGALRHLVREAAGDGWLRADAVVTRPWFVVLGSTEAGISRTLERAGFRRIVSCALPGEAPVCVFWLSMDAGHGSVCIEVSGSALTDTEACEQLFRFLRRLRTAPDAVVLQVALQEIWGPSDEQARAAAVQLGPALHTLFRQYNREISVHLVCSQIARLDGLPLYFRSAERRPWGFRLDRPLHSDFQASLVQERMDAILKSLWQKTNTALSEGSLEPSVVEVVLDFPRELLRMSGLLSAFITKLCESFSADTRARLHEVFFVNADPGSPFEAARHRRLPLARQATAAAAADPQGGYFLSGLFVRLAGLSRQEGPRPASRQIVMMSALAALSVLLMTLLSSVYNQRHRAQEAVRRQSHALLKSMEQLTKIRPPTPGEKSPELHKAIGDFLQQDGDATRIAKRLGDMKERALGGSPAQGLVDDVIRRSHEYLQCQAANHLVGPLLSFEKKDLLAASAYRPMSSSQPLYDRLQRLNDFVDPKKRGGKAMALSPLSTTEWFDALYAIALLQRRSCKPSKEDSKWLSEYLRSLWPLSSESDDGLARRMEERLLRLLTPYLSEVELASKGGAAAQAEPKLCARLGTNIQEQPVAQARRLLERGGVALGAQSGIDVAAALELELRIKSSAKESKDGGLKPFKGTGLSYFLPRGEDIPGEATRAGCQRILGSATDQIRWLRCILPSESAGTWDSGGVSSKRLGEQYRLRLEQVWTAWLLRLRTRSPSPPPTLENELNELASAASAVMTDLPSLFRSIGMGEPGKPEALEACRESLRGFAPFRWAVDLDDELGSPKPAQLTNAWKEYQTAFGSLRELLLALGRPQKTPEEGLTQVLAALTSLTQVEQKRIDWLAALRTALAQAAAPGSSLGDGLEKKAPLVEGLRDLEEKILVALQKKGRRLVACQWDSMRRRWGDAVASSGAQPGAPGHEEQRGRVRPLLAEFRDQTLSRLFAWPACEPRPTRLVESSSADGGRLVGEAFCRRIKEIIDQTAAPGAPPPPPGGDKPAAAPSVVPTPDSKCMRQPPVLRTYLDVPELQARYVCNVSQRQCDRVSATTAHRVQLQVEWVGAGLSDPVQLGSLRDVLARPAVTRNSGGRPSHLEPDPWKQQEPRYAVDVEAASLCQGRRFRLYFDESVAGRGPAKPTWVDPNYLDAAAQLIQDTCR